MVETLQVLSCRYLGRCTTLSLCVATRCTAAHQNLLLRATQDLLTSLSPQSLFSGPSQLWMLTISADLAPPPPLSSFSSSVFETGSCYVAQAALKVLMIFLAQTPSAGVIGMSLYIWLWVCVLYVFVWWSSVGGRAGRGFLCPTGEPPVLCRRLFVWCTLACQIWHLFPELLNPSPEKKTKNKKQLSLPTS